MRRPEQPRTKGPLRGVVTVILHAIYGCVLPATQNSVLAWPEPATAILPRFWANLGSIKLLAPPDLPASLPDILLVLRDLLAPATFDASTMGIFLGYIVAEKAVTLEQKVCWGTFADYISTMKT